MLLPLLARLRRLAMGPDLRFDGRNSGHHESRTSLRTSSRCARSSGIEIRSPRFRDTES